MSDQLTAMRVRIDEIDAELRRLLNERAQCALDVAELKKSNSAESSSRARLLPART